MDIYHNKNYNLLDIGRVFAAIAVVAIHVLGPENYPFLFNTILTIAVPFFFLVSSFLFFKKNREGADIKKYIKRIMGLYVFWLFYNIPLMVLNPSVHGGYTLRKIVYAFFFSQIYPVSWFLTTCVFSILLIYGLSKILHSFSISLIAFFIYSFFNLSTQSQLLPYCCYKISFFLIGEDKLMTCGWYVGFLFMSIGKLLAEHEEILCKCNKNRVKFIFLLLSITNFAYYFVLTPSHPLFSVVQHFMIIALSIFLFIMMIIHSTSRRLPYLKMRRLSVVFYLSHFLIFNIIAVFMHHILHIRYPLVDLCLTITFTYFFFCLIDFLYFKKNFKWLRYAF